MSLPWLHCHDSLYAGSRNLSNSFTPCHQGERKKRKRKKKRGEKGRLAVGPAGEATGGEHRADRGLGPVRRGQCLLGDLVSAVVRHRPRPVAEQRKARPLVKAGNAEGRGGGGGGGSKSDEGEGEQVSGEQTGGEMGMSGERTGSGIFLGFDKLQY